MNNRGRCVFLVVCIVLVFFPKLTWAWSQQLHTTISTKVYASLSKKEKKYYERLASSLPYSGKQKLSFVHMSSWVDTIKQEPIGSLFKNNIPEDLRVFQSSTSAAWHYDNFFYFPNDVPRCRPSNKGLLLQAITRIDQALKKDISKAQEALLIAFMVHLMEDAHQPLHTSSRVDKHCKHDRGGNNTCIKYYAKKCVTNLHQLWDQGFGLSRDKAFWASFHYRVSDEKSRFTDLISKVLAEGQGLAPKVYLVKPNLAPSADYIAWAKNISAERLTLGTFRITEYLKAHYEQQIQR